MVTLQIQLPDDLKERLAARASESGHASMEEHVQMLIRADTAAGEEYDPELEAMLLRRLDSGPGIPLTPEFVAEHRRQLAEKLKSAGRQS